jgi:hypothetical protein
MLARIIVSGLVLDATVEVSDLFKAKEQRPPNQNEPVSHRGVYMNQLRTIRENLTRAATLQGPDRSPSRAPARPSEPSSAHPAANLRWKDQRQRDGVRGRQLTDDSKQTHFVEAPFQKAIEKEKSLAAAQRPYLRHSWQ